MSQSRPARDPLNPFENRSNYVINPEDPSETMRLHLLDDLMTREMGSLFPQDFAPPAGHLVLDLACGPGGWVLTCAKDHPELEIIGVDISQKMIRYAQAQAGLRALSNANFQEMNILEPLAFPDAAFAFVNARLISGLVSKEAWPRLLQECMRVLEPGGILRLTDGEFPCTTSPAHEQLATLGARAFWVSGRSFSEDGRRIDLVVMLAQLLREAGFYRVQHQAYAMECSYGTDAYDPWIHNALIGYPLFLPFLLKEGVTTQQEFEQLYQQMTDEMQSPAFRGVHFFLSAWGSKPPAG